MKYITIIVIIFIAFDMHALTLSDDINYSWLHISYSHFFSPNTVISETAMFLPEYPGSYKRVFPAHFNGLGLTLKPYGLLLINIELNHIYNYPHMAISYDDAENDPDSYHYLITSGMEKHYSIGYRIIDKPDAYADIYVGLTYLKEKGEIFYISNALYFTDGDITEGLEPAYFIIDYFSTDISFEFKKMYGPFGFGSNFNGSIYNNYNETAGIEISPYDWPWEMNNRRGPAVKAYIFGIVNYAYLELNFGFSFHYYDLIPQEWVGGQTHLSNNDFDAFYWGPKIKCGIRL